MMAVGLVEIISTDFVSGWHDLIDERPALLYASLDGRVIGFGEASIQRRDLVREAEQGLRDARAFLISFKEPLPSERLHEITVRDVQSGSVLSRGLNVKSDRNPKQQIFVLGSPRSGTSELGSTLASQLQLPWLGEGHAAPLFAQAAEAMAGDRKSANGFVRDIAEQDYARVIVETAQKAYYNIHASASFVDKTPGIPMIAAAPFLLQCFPKAKWIYLSRNGIANVLSRLEKFGTKFERSFRTRLSCGRRICLRGPIKWALLLRHILKNPLWLLIWPYRFAKARLSARGRESDDNLWLKQAGRLTR